MFFSKELRESIYQEIYNTMGNVENDDYYYQFIEQVERQLLNVAIIYAKNNQARAAKILGMSRSTLISKLKTYQIISMPQEK